MKLLTPDQVKDLDDGVVKFVKVGGQWRFVLFGVFDDTKHSDMVKPGETATAAGLLGLSQNYANYALMLDDYSMTLKVGIGEDDYKELEALLGKRIKRKWE